MFCGKIVVQLVQPPLLCGDYPLARVHHLQLNEPAGAVPQLHQTLDSLGHSGAHVLPDHDAALAVEHVAVHKRKAVVAHIRLGWNYVRDFGLLYLTLRVLAVYVLDGLVQLLGQIRALDGRDGVVLVGVLCALRCGRSQHHFRMLQEILVYLEALGCVAGMHPIW